MGRRGGVRHRCRFEALTASDRTYTLGGGIPSSAVPIFQEEGVTLIVGTSAGGESIDPELGLPRARTFWGQEQ